MIADFYRTFAEVPDKGSDIPQEVLDILSQDLPSNFTYYKNDDEFCTLVYGGIKKRCITETGKRTA